VVLSILTRGLAADTCTAGASPKKLGRVYNSPTSSAITMIAYFQTGYRFMFALAQVMRPHGSPLGRPMAYLLDGSLGQHLDHRTALDLDFHATGDFDAQVGVTQLGDLAQQAAAVATSSPLASASIMARCSFWRFIWGRIITK
jgi:hypothetical protein